MPTSLVKGIRQAARDQEAARLKRDSDVPSDITTPDEPTAGGGARRLLGNAPIRYKLWAILVVPLAAVVLFATLQISASTNEASLGPAGPVAGQARREDLGAGPRAPAGARPGRSTAALEAVRRGVHLREPVPRHGLGDLQLPRREGRPLGRPVRRGGRAPRPGGGAAPRPDVPAAIDRERRRRAGSGHVPLHHARLRPARDQRGHRRCHRRHLGRRPGPRDRGLLPAQGVRLPGAGDPVRGSRRPAGSSPVSTATSSTRWPTRKRTSSSSRMRPPPSSGP